MKVDNKNRLYIHLTEIIEEMLKGGQVESSIHIKRKIQQKEKEILKSITKILRK